jgi:hypothetical protein
MFRLLYPPGRVAQVAAQTNKIKIGKPMKFNVPNFGFSSVLVKQIFKPRIVKAIFLNLSTTSAMQSKTAAHSARSC